ncbi:hypothetical protein RSOLAG1IB_09203 [Rhizoctonia solani AG-1 IB]|uniref:NmrA-like domain-containing protein n=1 Tax=Thanatephorus cucumeris (strain AG1-IB / isolate 7/3/14) TaxID=1108050 RepID=A0A0B7FSQ7_THACB|nr:hypothetical protein RSOLAG1IB_09203 [Rhizoctonia solani AG-1 IB]
MSSAPTFFILGATGYVGGSLLATLLKEYPSSIFSVLVRDSQSAEAVKSVSPDRVKIVLGSHSDTSVIEAEVEKADLTVNAANGDDLDLIASIINGFKNKSRKGILIHTSGSAVIIAEGAGPALGKIDERGNKIWDDTKVDDLRTIPASALHRPVDLAVLEAHNSGVVDAYIVSPGLIYGPGIGPVKTTSLQIPFYLQIFLRRRQAYFAGEGTNIWCNIHIQDLVQLYTRVISHGFAPVESATKVDAYNNYYFAASSEDAIKDMVELMASILYKKGLVDSPHAQSLSLEDQDGKLLALYLGHTSRAVSVRAKSLGWSPKENKLTEGAVMEAEIENFLKTTQTSA